MKKRTSTPPISIWAGSTLNCIPQTRNRNFRNFCLPLRQVRKRSQNISIRKTKHLLILSGLRGRDPRNRAVLHQVRGRKSGGQTACRRTCRKRLPKEHSGKRKLLPVRRLLRHHRPRLVQSAVRTAASPAWLVRCSAPSAEIPCGCGTYACTGSAPAPAEQPIPQPVPPETAPVSPAPAAPAAAPAEAPAAQPAEPEVVTAPETAAPAPEAAPAEVQGRLCLTAATGSGGESFLYPLRSRNDRPAGSRRACTGNAPGRLHRNAPAPTAGKPVPDGNRFCTSCGMKIGE